MQDASNMLTRWAIGLQNFDFTVKRVAGKLNVVPGPRSRLFGVVEEEPLLQEPALASIHQNFPSDRPYRAPGPRDFQLSSQTFEAQDLAQNASAVSLFPLLDPEKLLEGKRAAFGPYIEYIRKSTCCRTCLRWRNQEPHESLVLERKHIVVVVFTGTPSQTRLVP